MARSKKKARRQPTEVFDFDLVAIAMEATEEVKMDGKLVELFDPDELERPRKIVRSNPSKKSDVPLPPNAGVEAPTSSKGKEKMAMQPENAFEDDVQKELRELKEAISMSRQEAKVIARSQKETTTRLGQSSAGPSNHMEGTDVHRGQLAASLQTKSTSMVEYRNIVARMLEECELANERNTSLEEELVMAQRKIEELKQRVKEAGIETSYPSICNDFKLVAASHRNPQLFYEHLKSIFDSYVNPDNNPDVQPLVKGLDVEDFDVDAFLGTNMGGRKEEMTPDFLDGLSIHDVRRLEFEIENICGEPQRITRATACLRLNYEQDVLPPPTTEENVTDSTVVPTVGCSIDLTADEAMDKPCSSPDRQIIFVVPSQRVDLTAVVSLEANRCPSRSPNLDFCADPWKVSLVIGAHLTSRNNMRNDALDSFPAIHKKEYIFHVLRTFLRLTMPICPETIVCGTMEMLAGAGMKGLGLDQCWRVEKLA
ncbi:hypothetical protein R1flu_010855 [Riccia fluitans]|uniref:Uncharacterized protein n=1 Tax=Riccia fluitans TaxID=41844 RepID=A0ABD1Z6A0_9MARC